MNIRAIDTALDHWIATRVTPPRSAGQHVSVILTDMLKTLPGRKYETWGRQRPENDRDTMWEAGYLWEDVLAKALSDRPVPGCHYVQPFELELDGIFGTPDRLLIQTEPDGLSWRIVDEEVKFTWMSCKELLCDPTKRPEKPEDWLEIGLQADIKFTYWLLQSKTYAAMLYLGGWSGALVKTHHTDPDFTGENLKPMLYRQRSAPKTTPLIRVRALFVNGAYKGELAIPGAWEIDYTPEELSTWWACVRDHARVMRESTAPPEAPEF